MGYKLGMSISNYALFLHKLNTFVLYANCSARLCLTLKTCIFLAPHAVAQNSAPVSGAEDHYQIILHVELESSRLQVFDSNCNKLTTNALYTNITNSKTHTQLQNRSSEHLLFPAIDGFPGSTLLRILITLKPRITNSPLCQPFVTENGRQLSQLQRWVTTHNPT